MKNEQTYFLVVVALLVAIVLLTSCEGSPGPIGPIGEKGNTGDQGSIGESKQITHLTLTGIIDSDIISVIIPDFYIDNLPVIDVYACGNILGCVSIPHRGKGWYELNLNGIRLRDLKIALSEDGIYIINVVYFDN